MLNLFQGVSFPPYSNKFTFYRTIVLLDDTARILQGLCGFYNH